MFKGAQQQLEAWIDTILYKGQIKPVVSMVRFIIHSFLMATFHNNALLSLYTTSIQLVH